jgi:hypothetical protein
MAISHGTTEYKLNNRHFQDPEDTPHVELESVKKFEHNTRPGEMYPPYWSLMPEFACRPPLGIPGQYHEPVLELNPTEGPPGTILLHVRRTGRVPRAPDPDADKRPPRPDAYRFWLDPARDYAVVRWDMISGGGSGGEESVDTTIVEELAKSPQGNWYATRTRRKDAIRDSKGQTYDQVTHIYVDFDVDLPDSLFEPPKPGRVYR